MNAARRLAIGCTALLAVVGAAWWSWPAAPLAPQAPARETMAVTAADDARRDPAPESAPPSREAAVLGDRGSLRGRVVDRTGTAVPQADVQLFGSDGSASPVATASTRHDGTFVLPSVAMGPSSLRLDAPGFTSVQLGDLDVERAADHDLDVGTLVLSPAVSYRGQVLSLGRAIAGASVCVRPEFGPPGQATPLVLNAETDADGWFHFATAPAPPVYVAAKAPGYRTAASQRVERADVSLQLELAPLTVVHGLVRDAATGAAVTSALVRLRELGAGEAKPGLPLPDLRQDGCHRVEADGSFALEVDAASFAIEVAAEGFVATTVGPLDPAAANVPLQIPLSRGASLVGTVTWHGEPVAGTAGLWASDREQIPPHVWRSFDASPTWQLPAVPTGRWLLRVEAHGAARYEAWLDLNAPGQPRVTIALQDGARLLGKLLGPTRPASLVVCTHTSGSRISAPVRADGSYEVAGLFAGSWRAFVASKDGTWAATAARQLCERLEEPTFVLADGVTELRLDLPTPEQRFGALHGQLPSGTLGATLQLVPTDAGLARTPPGLRRAFADTSGAFELAPVLPGNWQFEVTRPDRPIVTLQIGIVAGQSTEVMLPP